MAPIPKTYDGNFEFVGKAFGLPPKLLKAIAYYDGPPIPHRRGGLMRISKTQAADYGRLVAPLKPSDLLEVQVSITVAAWLVQRIVDAYKVGPVSEIEAAWHNPQYAGLVLLGYQAGYAGPPANARGRGGMWVVDKMKKAGIPKAQWTYPNVIAAAKAAGLQSSRPITNPKTGASVGRLLNAFFYNDAPGVSVPAAQAYAGPATPTRTPTPAAAAEPVSSISIPRGGGGEMAGGGILLLFAALGLLAFASSRR